MKVILAHTLKPAEEARMNHKLAASLSKISGLEMILVGSGDFQIDIPEQLASAKYMRLFSGRSGIWIRVWNSLRFQKLLTTEKPDVVICCSPDLLLAALLHKVTNPVVLIFDCQENFSLNFLHQGIYDSKKFEIISRLFTFFLNSASRWIDRIWFAERVYLQQIKTQPGRAKVFENKVSPTLDHAASQNGKTLFYGGVITAEAGCCAALRFVDVWLSQFKEWSAAIVGYCPQPEIVHQIVNLGLRYPIHFKVETWVGSTEMARHISQASVVLMPYSESLANVGKVPTKFYEALFYGKPVLVQRGSYFSALASKYSAGIDVDFEQPENNDWSTILHLIQSYKPQSLYSEQFCFDSEALEKDFLALCRL